MARNRWWRVLLGCAIALGALLRCSPARHPASPTEGRPVATTSAVGSPTAEHPSENLPSLVLDAERAAWAGYDPRPLVALLSKSAVITSGRGEQPGPYDVSHGAAEWARLLDWQLSGRRPNIDDTRVEYADAKLEATDGLATLEVTRVIKSVMTQEAVHERFELRWETDHWAVIRLRWWPLEARFSQTTVAYDEAGLGKLDTAVDEVGATNPRQKALACVEALRYAEAVDWYEKLVATADGTPSDWLELGWSAAFAGRMARSEEAFREAARRDPSLQTPRDRPGYGHDASKSQ